MNCVQSRAGCAACAATTDNTKTSAATIKAIFFILMPPVCGSMEIVVIIVPISQADLVGRLLFHKDAGRQPLRQLVAVVPVGTVDQEGVAADPVGAIQLFYGNTA